MRVSGTNISMIRGDSESILVNMKDSNGLQVDFVDGDIVYLTIKENLNTDAKALQKTTTTFQEGVARILLMPEDTQEMKVKDYIYDIQLTSLDGTVTTIVRPSKFTIEGDVTRE